jgi:murein DD-endopeptidase MepM/ murein hydrolase activator NlpD
MRISTAAFLMILTTVFLSGCAQQGNMASVEDKGSQSFRREATQHVRSSMVYQQEAPVMEVKAEPLPAPQKQSYIRIAESPRWQWPVDGTVTERFGPQREGIANQGITIAAAEGTPIRATQSGTVAFVGTGVRDYGNMVILRHGDGTLSAYSHLRDVAVKKGEAVKGGNVIATVGKSGSAKTPQLHFAVREGEQAIDPLSKLPQQVASN